ncbi:methionine--tRNA ligase [Buchnera aphidicola (Mindarus keteleerifoliae)]|uniref:methionine--tRNA ligase n=1 Tax=Buchnera aphidicola TaxID=9 RepID=UPI0031B72A65
MVNKIKKILVTCAFPYANGPIHLGHMLEHIQADIWVRYHRMQGKEIWFISADDSHGTATMLRAKKLNISPEELTLKSYKRHKLDLLNFNISYDNYYLTHSEENYFFLKKIFHELNQKKMIEKKVVYQLYDSVKKMFLPDRFIKGTCPICFSDDQYGDNCEKCGSIYSAIDMINPKSVISDAIPIVKESTHLFFKLEKLTKMLEVWIRSGTLQKSVVNKTKEWFKNGLKNWNISRDAPYFGFKIPNFLNKYFYVWLDAPIGYISTFKNLCNQNKNIDFDEFWKKNSNCELYHFIGKDIIYFHSLFWPAILESSSFRKPTKIFVHGYLTNNGKKLSKSKNSFIKASDWTKYFNTDSIRYYYASKLSSTIEDIEFNLSDLVQKFNSEIINKVINLASRSARFINLNFNNLLSSSIDEEELFLLFCKESDTIGNFFKKREYFLAIKKIMFFADLANKYMTEKSPWIIAKKNSKSLVIQSICSMGINLFRIIIIWLSPVMPELFLKVEKFLNTKLFWKEISIPLVNHKILLFKPLYNRLNIPNVDLFSDTKN